MTRIVDAYNIRPYELKSGDVMIRTVTLHVMSDETYRMYISPYDDPYGEGPPKVSQVDGVPQGSRIYDDAESHTARQLFTTAVNAGLKPDDG